MGIYFYLFYFSESELNDWLDGLPSLLTEKKISFEKVKCIANIARCNLSAFIQSLDGYIESIMSNFCFRSILSKYLNNFLFYQMISLIIFQIIYRIFILVMRISSKKLRGKD